MYVSALVRAMSPTAVLLSVIVRPNSTSPSIVVTAAGAASTVHPTISHVGSVPVISGDVLSICTYAGTLATSAHPPDVASAETSHLKYVSSERAPLLYDEDVAPAMSV